VAFSEGKTVFLRGKNAVFPLALGGQTLTFACARRGVPSAPEAVSPSTEALDGHQEEGDQEESQEAATTATMAMSMTGDFFFSVALGAASLM